MRARSETVDDVSGSLFERSRWSLSLWDGVLSDVPPPVPAPVEEESSVWIKQQRFPYGQEPETQKV